MEVVERFEFELHTQTYFINSNVTFEMKYYDNVGIKY